MKYKNFNSNNYMQIMKDLNVGSLFAKVVDYYGWSIQEAKHFMSSPVSSSINDIEALSNIVGRILRAKSNNERVFVFGDYDADGICATTMLVKILRDNGIETGYYIPNRLEEGYGLNITRTTQAINDGYSLIITVDNGVKAHDSLKYAKECGIDVIVMDHHVIENEVDAYEVLHPHLLKGDLEYLCGAGCVLQIAKAMKLDLDYYLVLAMIATIGDMMELHGENRWIVSEGIKVLKKQKYQNIIQLLNNVNSDITTEDIGFQVVPKLNAIGRLADRANVNTVVRYLLSKDVDEIIHYSKQLNLLNQTRKQLTEEHLAQITLGSEKTFIVVSSESFHPGIVGLVANRLSKEHNLPTMVCTLHNGNYVGSIRGVSGIDLMECVEPIKNELMHYGGHKMAVGLSFGSDKLSLISDYLQNYKYQLVEDCIDCVVVDDSDMTNENVAELFQYGPYGQGISLPLFVYDLPKIANYNYMKKTNYLKWKFTEIEGIWFSKTCEYNDFVGKDSLRFIGKLQTNVFRNIKNYVLQLEHVEK